MTGRERFGPYSNTYGERLAEGFDMTAGDYEDHGGLFEDKDVYYPSEGAADVVDIREFDNEQAIEFEHHARELNGMWEEHYGSE